MNRCLLRIGHRFQDLKGRLSLECSSTLPNHACLLQIRFLSHFYYVCALLERYHLRWFLADGHYLPLRGESLSLPAPIALDSICVHMPITVSHPLNYMLRELVIKPSTFLLLSDCVRSPRYLLEFPLLFCAIREIHYLHRHLEVLR